jgi:hypothetical protein
VSAGSIIGTGEVVDNAGGNLTRRFTFVPSGNAGLSLFRPGTATAHQLFVSARSDCHPGAGVTLHSVEVDVVGYR